MAGTTAGHRESPAADVLVIGGGPAGATAALQAARNGLRAVVLEKERHPRFHVGESFLPRNLELIRQLGLEQRLKTIPRTVKLGASFVMGDEAEPQHYYFDSGLLDTDSEAFNIERAGFDAMIVEAAREAGVEVIENAAVREVSILREGEVALDVRLGDGSDATFRGRMLLDASGQSTVVGRHLNTRRTLPDLKKVAYFGHFKHVPRESDERGGFPLIVMCSEGWFWLIPIDEERTSIGLVMDAEQARRVDVPPRKMLAWAIERCPHLRDRTRNAEVPESNGVTADFSYSCAPFAGPGYFLVGDAATFVDPIFSTGVCLGMMSGVLAADLTCEVLTDKLAPDKARRRYSRYVEQSSAVFFRLVRGYYRHSFREIFLNKEGPLQMHRAVISVLSGHVFPRVDRSVRWRMRMFELCVSLQRYLPLVPRRQPFSLLDGPQPVAESERLGGPEPVV